MAKKKTTINTKSKNGKTTITVKKGKKKAKATVSTKVIVAVFFIAIIVGGVIVLGMGTKWYKDWDFSHFTANLTNSLNTNKTTPTNTTSTGTTSHTDEHEHAEGVKYDDFQIHFMELGNEYAGDSTYIKAGDVDILIDAGSRGSSATTLTSYINQYCTDGKLEYVISTHNHQDHIAAFAGTSKSGAKNFKGETVGKTGIFYYYEVGTLIDFTYATVTVNKKSVNVLNKEQKSSDYGSSTEYGKYLAAREYLVSKGTKYYTAKDLWDSNNTKFALTSDVTMSILYNEFYFKESSDINNYSVCSLFTYKDHNFLLTGDLEKEGEERLASYYDGSTPDKVLPHCDLFKGGHHGSKTSSNECLLSKITPEICCVCCCAGTTEYTVNRVNTFPTQDFIDRIAKYTDNVYITSMWNEETEKFESMNGNICVSSNGTDVAIYATNNLTKLKDTLWITHTVYVDNNDKIVKKGTAGAKEVPCRTIPKEWKTS